MWFVGLLAGLVAGAFFQSMGAAVLLGAIGAIVLPLIAKTGKASGAAVAALEAGLPQTAGPIREPDLVALNLRIETLERRLAALEAGAHSSAANTLLAAEPAPVQHRAPQSKQDEKPIAAEAELPVFREAPAIAKPLAIAVPTAIVVPVQRPTVQAPPERTSPRTAAPAEPSKALAPPAPSIVVPSVPRPSTPARAPAPPPPPPPPPPAIPFRDRLPAPIRSLIFGGNMLVKLGVLILFLGLAFLLRYTAERVTVPIELRYAGVAAVGAALLALGWFLRRKRASYALILQGAGIGVFYLTTLAAMKVHELLPPTIGFGFLFAVAVLSAVLAVAQNAPVLAIVAALEGFAAPVLASTGSNNAIGLFSYLLVLDIGIFLVAWFKAWRLLNLIGAVGTFTLASAWAQRYYTADQYGTVQIFLVAFFVLFAAIGLLFARRTLFEAPPDDKLPLAERALATLRRVGRVDSALVFGAPMAAFGLQYLMARQWEFGAAFSALGFGAFYLSLGWFVFFSQPRGLRLLAEGYAIVGVIFATLAIPLGLEGQWTGATWALEAAGMYWLGVRQARPYARAFSFVLLAGSVVQLLRATSVDGAAGHPLLHGSFLGPLMVAGGIFASLILLRRAKLHEVLNWESRAGSVLPWVGMAALALLPWQTLTPPWAAMASSLLALMAFALGRRRGMALLQPVALVLQALAAAAFGLALHVGEMGETDGPLLQGPVVAALGLGVSILITWLLQRPVVRSTPRPWDATAGLTLPWVGMAALTLAPFMLLPQPSAAVATGLMALTAYAVALRASLQPLRLIAFAMQSLAVLVFATSLQIGAEGAPLLAGSVGAVACIGAALVSMWALYLRAGKPADVERADWEAIASTGLPWAAMAAFTTVCWLTLTGLWAPAAAALLALCCFTAGVRWMLSPLRPIAHSMQALSVVALIAGLHPEAAGAAAFASGWQGTVAAGLVAFSLLATAGWAMWHVHRDALVAGTPPYWSMLQVVSLLVGVSLLHLAMLFGVDLARAALIWPFTAAVVLWLALRMAHRPLAVLAAVLHLLAAVLFVGTTPSWDEVRPAFANLGFWTPLALGATALVAADWLRAQARYASLARNTDADANATAPVARWANHWCARAPVLWASLLWGAAWWIAATLGESVHVLAAQSLWDRVPATIVGVMLLSSMVASVVAARRDWRQLGQLTVLTLPMFMAAALTGLLFGVTLPSTGFGWLAWPLALLWHVRLLHAQRRWLPPALQRVLHVAGLWFFLLMAARECQWRLVNLGEAYSAWPMLGWVLVPVIVLWALRSRFLLTRWPLTEYRSLYLEFALQPVALCLLCWCWATNVLSAGDAAPLPFVPVLNPLELAQWLALAALVLWWRALPASADMRLPPRWAKGVAALTAWALLTGAVLRACHHYADVTWGLDALYLSTLTQAALSIAWAICGVLAMVLGNRRGTRIVWMAGVALLGVVVLKLFFVELANQGSLFRIVSFIGVGTLLLLVGYFAPVPTLRRSATVEVAA
ncbi:hypothetical protein BH11PSE13_BH11PSE13_04970 [soil metagenome]